MGDNLPPIGTEIKDWSSLRDIKRLNLIQYHKKMTEKKQDILNQITKTAQTTLPQGGELILFGSQARGDARHDSDWDLLVLLDIAHPSASDYDKYGYPFVNLGWQLGESINPVMYGKHEWQSRKFTELYQNVQREGIRLC